MAATGSMEFCAFSAHMCRLKIKKYQIFETDLSELQRHIHYKLQKSLTDLTFE